MTRPVTVGKAGPRLERGGRFGASLASYDRRLAEATLTLTGESAEGPTVNSPPLFNTRYFPEWEKGTEPLDEHVWAGGEDREISPIWEGEATLRFFESPADELSLLAPLEVGKGFWLSFGYTVDGEARWGEATRGALADEDRRGAPELREPGRGVCDGQAARVSFVLPEAAEYAGAPRRRDRATPRVPIPELRG